MPRAAAAEPSVVYDGRFYWYTERFDPSDDRCCRCRELIPEDQVPLTLFKDVGRETWQARFCDRCAEPVVIMLKVSSR